MVACKIKLSIIYWLALIPSFLECGSTQSPSELTPVAKFASKIIDCFFIDGNTDAVELICDHVASIDNCFSLLFEDERQDINRLEVNAIRNTVLHLSIGQCRTHELDESLSELFPNLISLDISNLKFKWDDLISGGELNFVHLQKLNASNSLTNIDSKLFANTKNITEIDLSYSLEQTISSITFEGVSTLTTINLSRSGIAYLQTNSFMNLKYLEVIDLSYNVLYMFDMHIFDNNLAIREIHLQCNRIKHLICNSNCSSDFKCLVYFDITMNNMENWYGNIVKHLGGALQVLHWSDNALLVVYENTFEGLCELREVHLRNTNLLTFNFKAFECPNKLQFLDLSKNNLRIIQFESTHGNFTNLKTLILEDNSLKRLDGASIILFPQLSIVAVSKNYLTNDAADRFIQQWTNLTVIGDPYGQKPLLTYGPEIATKITDCIFIDNRTTAVELICENVTQSNDGCYSTLFLNQSTILNRLIVKHLRTGQCRSMDFDGSLAEIFPHLDILDVSHLGLQWEYPVGGPKINFISLTKLDASNNHLRKMTVSMFTESDLIEEIDLSHNKFAKVVLTHFNEAVALKMLNLSYNQITYFETAAIKNLRQLQMIDLSNNLLRMFDLNMFQYNSLMQEIYIQNNRINSLIFDIELFKRFDLLTVFNASGNRITIWSDGVLQSLGSALQVLDLSQNFLSNTNASTLFKSLYSLRHVNLRNTLLQLFSFDGFENPDALQSLDLSENQLTAIDFTSKNGNFSNLDILLLNNNLLHHFDGASITLFPRLSLVAISRNQLTCKYAKDFIGQWDGLTVIGNPCDQNSLIFERVEIGAFGKTLNMIAFIGFVALTCVFVILFVIRRKNLLKNIDNSGKCVDIDANENQKKEHIYEEPIYYEITTMAQPYDQLRFDAMEISAIKSHYHNASALKMNHNVKLTF